MIEQQFKEAMGRFAGAVTAITTFANEQPAGLIATAVCSLSCEPPSVIVCVNKTASAHDLILNNGYFGVSLLAPAHATSSAASTVPRAPSASNATIGSWITARPRY